jgi:quinol monooxygenase YgiN
VIHVVAIIAANPGRRTFVLDEFEKMRLLTLKEAGCVQYDPVVDTGNGDLIGPDTFMVIEKWETLASLDAHNTSAHLAAFVNTVKPQLASLKVHVLKPA